MTVTEKELVEYRDLLYRINRMAQDDLKGLWAALKTVDREVLISGVMDGVPQIVELYRAMAADVSTAFYGDTQGISFTADEALAAAQVNREQVEASLRWALFATATDDPLGLVSGIVQKHVVDGARSYGLRSFANEGSGWYRAANPEACEFCRLLATRALTDLGSAYSSAEAAVAVGKGGRSARGSQPEGAAFHTNCMCVPVKASEFRPARYYEDWTREYYQAVREAGGAGNVRAVTAAMRRLNK